MTTKKTNHALLQLLLLLLLSSAAFAQAPANPRDALDPEFAGMETTFVYKDEGGVLRVEQVFTRLSRLKRGIDAFPITSVTGEDLQSIPTASLAAEHWWLSFEMLMLAQRDYAECVGGVNEHMIRRGWCLVDDVNCSPIATTVLVLRDYWVPFNIVFDSGIPSRLTYIAHFEAGISGIDQTLLHVNSCKSYLTFLRTLP